jgi:hypothetical protein
MIGKKFQHKHILDLRCEIISETAKGFKVLQTEGRKKAKTAFYHVIDFDSKKGFWTPIN